METGSIEFDRIDFLAWGAQRFLGVSKKSIESNKVDRPKRDNSAISWLPAETAQEPQPTACPVDLDCGGCWQYSGQTSFAPSGRI